MCLFNYLSSVRLIKSFFDLEDILQQRIAVTFSFILKTILISYISIHIIYQFLLQRFDHKIANLFLQLTI